MGEKSKKKADTAATKAPKKEATTGKAATKNAETKPNPPQATASATQTTIASSKTPSRTGTTAKTTSTAKPSSKKTAARQATAAATPKKTATKPHKTSSKKSKLRPITPEEHRIMISEAAYYIAEKQGFQKSNPVENWIQAEAQIDAMLIGKPKPPQ